ncbi:hypothetical protein VHUM_01620 [Vanrija humicola]|uniref:Uncharacterized protein n=1 Tax=Vanrija humicola TaxID=5417 RepID=A0A7D8V3G6_VANHU|nr:hypothetical protein VHUM_01620 [Vanrija humicola]
MPDLPRVAQLGHDGPELC